MNFLYNYVNYFVIHQWDPKGNIVHSYVFIGKNYTDSLKTELSKKFKLSKNVTFIEHLIYKTDTIETLHYKIASHCLNTNNITDMHLWAKCEINEDEQELFIQDLFKNELKLGKSYINHVTESLFDKAIYKDDLYEVVFRDDFNNFKANNMYKSLTHKFKDLNDFEVFVSPDPFKSLNETTSKTKVTSLYKSLLKSFEANEIHFTTKHTTLDPIYFKHNNLTFDKKISKMIAVKMDIQNEFVDTKNIVSDIFERIELLTLRVLPISHDIDINLHTLFQVTQTSYEIPIIVYKSKYTNSYKVNKLSLLDMNKKQVSLFEEKEQKQKDSIINRSNEVIIFYIKLVDNIYFYFLLNSNGSYKVKYKIHNALMIDIKDILKSFAKFVPIYDFIDNPHVNKITPNTNIFNSKLIEVIDFNTNNVLTFNTKIKYKYFLENLEKNPFFGNKQNKKKGVESFQFIDTNNFYNTDTITNFLYVNAELDNKELLNKMQHFFQISEEEAKDLYDEHKKKLLLPITRKGKNVFAIRQHHIAVNVKLNIMSDHSIRVYTSNTQDTSYKSLILYYLTQFLTQNIKFNKFDKIKTTNDLEDDKISFTDLQDWNMNISDDIENILNDIDIPVFDTEIDIEDYDDILNEQVIDEQMSENSSSSNNFDQDTQTVSDKQKQIEKADYTTFVLLKLYEADPNLFRWKGQKTKLNNYSSKCGNVNFRQPIVISKEEKDHIDKTQPDSYTGFVQTGSTDELAAKNFYICPKIWCRFSRVSLTDEVYKKLGNKCPGPYNEEAMFFPPRNTQDNYFINKDNIEVHYPSLLNANKHPNNKRLPCCGKTPFVEESEKGKKKKTANYISNISHDMILNENQFGELPKILNTLLSQDAGCSGQMDSRSKCFVRTGNNNKKNSLLYVLSTILKQDVVKTINETMTIEDFIFLNGGNTMKRFSNNGNQLEILDTQFYKLFQKYFKNNKDYINKFNLQDEYDYIINHDKFEYDDKNTALSMSLIREHLIFKAFLNFKQYILIDDIEKDFDDIIHLLTYEWLNKQKYNIIVLEYLNDDLYFLNPKYYHFGDVYSPDHMNILLYKIENHYEFVSYIGQKASKDILSDVLISTTKIHKIINQVNIKKSKYYDSLYDNSKLHQYILNHSMKCIGIVDKSQNIILYDDEISLIYDKSKTYEFINIDKIKQDTKEIKERQKTENINIHLFVNTFDVNKNQETKEEMEYFNEVYRVAREINSKKKIKDALNVLNHSIANFTDNEKGFLLRKILTNNNINIKDTVDMNMLLHDLIHLPLKYILSYYRLKVNKKNKNEIQLTYEDIILKKLSFNYDNFKLNEFQIFEKSSEDILKETEYIKLKIIKEDEDLIQHNNMDTIKNPSTNLVWTINRVSLKPSSLKKDFPNLNVIDEVIDLHKLIALFNTLKETVTFEKFKKKLTDRIASEYNKNNDSLLKYYKLNPNSVLHKIGKKSNINELIKLIELPDYYYSILELEVLSNMSGYNIIILGRNTSYIKNGIKLINANTNNYILFMYGIDNSRHTFKLVNTIDDNKFVFQTDDFSVEQLEKIKLSE